MPAPTNPTEIALQASTTNGMSSAEKKKQARAKFEGVYQVLRKDLLDHFAGEGMPKDAIEWYSRNLDYNVPGGKLNRGMSVVDSVEIIKGRALTDEEYLKSAILGWCIELLQAFFLVSDDLMDSSVTRRGQPCWYRVENVGLISINDAFMLEGAIYHLLKKYFRQDSYYVELLDLFHDVTYKTEMGQLIDLITAPEDHVDLDKFSLKKHQLIVIYKTAFYSFYLPVALAMHVCGIPPSPNSPSDPYKLAHEILIPLGEYFQVQDDFLDFGGTPEQIGKIGTDILDNKCSWCINTALAVATLEQRRVLDENYGRKDAAKEAKVKEVFEQVEIRRRYEEYEQTAYERINGLIETIPADAKDGELKREVFTSFLSKIYKRTK
ncbi:isoprenoid biosynthesis-like protein [Punctularia strigosozonata HHB-11173 SS5]|uniref:(2E,6E)-farnesyl diphosphate synthase n=1 Tax=Punctularia strigosozonata (strain HHB-11173) TaxID=741275 RepID=R7S2J9_PUNST|nr:isoprenoid biosynthesis-like protein [Punctularia strigosozonata HHB-11173 SS5]EIN04079.1 isoprenoid biosynthesis-like protein [Punctularia strigosozonata HHB-11173 SS5]